jgi:hypothetical protein
VHGRTSSPRLRDGLEQLEETQVVDRLG